jgi:predicted amidophosphoribosyltransferase
VRLCPLPGPLYAVLMGYKESPVSEARRRFAPMVRALFDGFLANHAGCLAAAAGGPLDLVLPVPSTARPGGSPLSAVEGLAPAVCARAAGARWSPHLLTRSRAPVGHMRPDARAFEVPADFRPDVSRRRAVLLDDTYVSGARAQSAAAALRRAGAASVVIVTLGRVLRPDRSAAHAGFLGRWRAPTASPGSGLVPAPCCRCAQTGAPTE